MSAIYMYHFLNDSRFLTCITIPRLLSSYAFKILRTLYDPTLPEISQLCLFACLAHLGRILHPVKPHQGLL